jgi:hypothetical protein
VTGLQPKVGGAPPLPTVAPADEALTCATLTAFDELAELLAPLPVPLHPAHADRYKTAPAAAALANGFTSA